MTIFQEKKTFYYVLYVKTGKEEQVCKKIRECLCNQSFTPFFFKKNVGFKKGNKISKVTRAIFPGYVFIKSNLMESDFFTRFIRFAKKTNDIIRLLNYGSNEKLAVNETELYFLIDLCDNSYCIEYSIGLIEGDRIKVIKGPLIGKESRIIKFNKQKKNAVIALLLMNEIRTVTIGLDYITKAN